MIDVVEHNRRAWNRYARSADRWSTPVNAEEIADARAGNPRIILTPDTPIPLEWLGTLQGKKVLCLASSGGQQAPLLAAAGADVTSYDLSEEQLTLDRQVAEREGLSIRLLRGDMRDLSALDDESFDLIVNVTSNVFVPDLLPVWSECFRVLRHGGELLVGFMNPCYFLFDHEEVEAGASPAIRHHLPFSSEASLPDAQLEQLLGDGEALEYSHSLTDQIGGQLRTGFVLTALFEDSWSDTPLSRWFKPTVNTRARKP